VNQVVGTGELVAVLFDMDGTLVDSEKVWQVALDELAAEWGGVMSEPVRKAMIGSTTARAIQMLHEDMGLIGRDVAADSDLLEDRMMTLCAGQLDFRPGAYELLTAVRAAGYKTALVTATVRRIVEVMLDTIGRENFDIVVTHDDVVNGKPDPEPYRTAAAALGAFPGDCVAIEDSPTGAASASTAGCVVFAVPSEVDLSRLTGVTHVASLTDVDVDFLRKAIETR
jgi:HAD superfamily hydrolase (TIGR01509 family)